MKIVHIIPGSGGTFYCQNCVRDLGVVQAMRRSGQDVVVVPMYLPLELNEPGLASESPLFYGAVRTYLTQTLPGFQALPGWLARLLDARPLLGLAARQAGSTSAPGLAELTLSMLAGQEGRQADELDRLVSWLKREARPDIVSLSNALLLGLAAPIKAATGAKVVCHLQDEDVWVEAMPATIREEIWRLATEKAKEVDHFIAVSRYYGEAMRQRLALPADRLSVIYPGTDFNGYPPARPESTLPAIGFLSRRSEALGLGILVDSFILLKRQGRIPGLQLHLAGGQTPADAPFLRRQRRKLQEAGCLADVLVLDRFDRQSRAAFLARLSLLSVPAMRGEAFATYAIEALGCGVPVVLPQAGAFPELVETTGGGLLYEPNTAPALAAALEALLLDPRRLKELALAGQACALRQFSIENSAEATLAAYRRLLPAL